MTSDWKSAKRKATARYLKNKTRENWELRRRTSGNAATKQRRIAINEFWRKETEDLKNNPKCFYKTFTEPFLSTKDSTKGEEIPLNVNGSVIKDQKQVPEVLVQYFATIADGIGGDAARCKVMEDFKDHPSVQQVHQETDIHNGKQTIKVKVNPVTQEQVLAVLESLNIRKATGSDGIPPKVFRIVWPSGWKRGDWTAVYRRDDKLFKQLRNYTNQLNRVMEKSKG